MLNVNASVIIVIIGWNSKLLKLIAIGVCKCIIGNLMLDFSPEIMAVVIVSIQSFYRGYNKFMS